MKEQSLLENAIKGMAAWLEIDLEQTSQTLRDYVIDLADPSALDYQHLMARLAEGDLDHFSVGERAPSGHYLCRDCGLDTELEQHGHLHSCLGCGSEQFEFVRPGIDLPAKEL